MRYRQYCSNTGIYPITAFRSYMSEKLDIIAKGAQGVFVSSSLFSSKDESSSSEKFQPIYPNVRLHIFQIRQRFIRETNRASEKLPSLKLIRNNRLVTYCCVADES